MKFRHPRSNTDVSNNFSFVSTFAGTDPGGHAASASMETVNANSRCKTGTASTK